jgi:hypothetical protein
MRLTVRDALRADIEKGLPLGIGAGVGEVRHPVGAHAPRESQHDVQQFLHHGRRAVICREALLLLLLGRPAGGRDQALAGSQGPPELGGADPEFPCVKVAGFPTHFAATPDGTRVYVTSGQSVTPIATGTSTAGHPFSAGFGPWAIALTADGAAGYVTDDGTGMHPGDKVTPFRTKTDTTGKAIKVGLSPVAIALTP